MSIDEFVEITGSANNWGSALASLSPQHPLLIDLQEKSSAFDQAALKYSAKVSS